MRDNTGYCVDCGNYGQRYANGRCCSCQQKVRDKRGLAELIRRSSRTDIEYQARLSYATSKAAEVERMLFEGQPPK